MFFLKQSTASQAVLIGPFVDTDGAAVTGLTIDAADIRLSKNGANIVAKNSGGGTHDELGMYTITLDATDTDTVGRLQLTVVETGALTVYHEYHVLEETVFDALFGASALGYVANAPVNVAQISGDSTAADNLETAFDDTAGPVPWTGIIDQGTAQSATATTIVLRAAAAFANDEILGATIYITGGTTGVGQSRVITDYVSSTDTATVDAWTTTPSGTITYKIVPTAPNSTSEPIPVNVIEIDGSAVDINSAQLGVNIVAGAAGAITATVIADGAIDAATFAADVDAEILSYIVDDATRIDASSLNTAAVTTIPAILVDTGTTLDGLITTVDTVVDGIKAKTDSLTFTVAGQVDANAVAMNDVEILGAGTSGDLWRG